MFDFRTWTQKEWLIAAVVFISISLVLYVFIKNTVEGYGGSMAWNNGYNTMHPDALVHPESHMPINAITHPKPAPIYSGTGKFQKVINRAFTGLPPQSNNIGMSAHDEEFTDSILPLLTYIMIVLKYNPKEVEKYKKYIPQILNDINNDKYLSNEDKEYAKTILNALNH